MNLKRIGARLRRQREQKKLTQAQLAKLTKLGQPTIARLEEGQEPRVAQLYVLFLVFKPAKSFGEWLEELTK